VRHGASRTRCLPGYLLLRRHLVRSRRQRGQQRARSAQQCPPVYGGGDCPAEAVAGSPRADGGGGPMAGSRPSNLSGGEDPALSPFTQRAGQEKPAVPDETVRRVSDEGGFPSRTPKPSTPAQPPKRLSATKTGRTVLLNARVTQRAHDRFHDIVEA